MKKILLLSVLVFVISMLLIACGESREAALPHEAVPVSDEIAERFPEYCGLDESKGLTVYVWQMGHESYSFGLMEGTPETHEGIALMRMKTARAEDMTEILNSYTLPRSEILLVPYQHMLSSYISKIWVYDENGKVLQSDEDYIRMTREMIGIG